MSGVRGTSVLCCVPDVHVIALDDEKVLYVPDSETLQHLDPLATVVWDCLRPPAPVQDIAADLADVFGADPALVTADVVALLDRLVSSGALRDVAEIPPDA
jgi:hypothetical protein